MKPVNVFEAIKKQNGEKFAKAVRNYDNGIFDVPNIVDIVKYAGRKAEPIMNYLVSLKNIRIDDHALIVSPFELLHRAGYHAEYADTLDKQNSIKKYFKDGEKLCTFNDDSRYRGYYIINAVKYDVDKIKRENFKNPMREDEYGTSVISIQVLKKGGFISIKNRYNHTVDNPDNTFKSNPDNIIYGLSAAIKSHFHVNFSSQKDSVPDGYALVGNKILQFNYEVNNVYFGENFYARDGIIYELDKNTELMMDYFIYDARAKTSLNPAGVKDPFETVFYTETNGKSIQISKDTAGHKCITASGAPVVTVESGKIVGVNILRATRIEKQFLQKNDSMEFVNVHGGIEYIGDNFLNSYRCYLIGANPPRVNIAYDVAAVPMPTKLERKAPWGLPLRPGEHVVRDHVIRDADGVDWIHNGPGFYNNQNIKITVIMDGKETVQDVDTGYSNKSLSAIKKLEKMFSEKYKLPVKIYGFLCAGSDDEEGWFYQTAAPKYSSAGRSLVYKTRLMIGNNGFIDDSVTVFLSRFFSSVSRVHFGACNVGVAVDAYTKDLGAAFDSLESCVKRYTMQSQNQKT